MPVGDSITRGYLGSLYRWGYRKPLYDLLTGSDFDFDFVGCKIDGSFADPQHEGRDGWRADELLYGRAGAPAEGKLSDWLVADQPDVVLLHIGTNDVTQGNADPCEVNALLDVIDNYEIASGRHVTVILALIINRRIDSPAYKRAQTTQLNSDVNAIATSRIANGDDIIVVDMESVLDYAIGADMSDEVHPNDAGYTKMAQVWYDALADYFNSFVFVISGRVVEPDGQTPVAGMLIASDNNDVNALTDANGFYELEVNYHWSGITKPEKDGYIFEPNGYEYSDVDQDLTDMDYIAAPTVFTISGFVLEQSSASPVSGVSIEAENGGGSAITDANGYYEIAVDFNWSGSVAPEKYAYVFEPKSRSYQDVNQDFIADQNFSGTGYDYRIYGYIDSTVCSVPVGGVQVNATQGGADAATDSNGFYEVWVNAGWSGTVTPAKAYYTFEAVSTDYEDVQADQRADYIGENIYDLDCDGSVGWGDVLAMADNWLSTDPGATGNLVPDGSVNFLDLAYLASIWQNE
jgi:hypothetical protein